MMPSFPADKPEERRWTIYVCKDCGQLAHSPGDRCVKDRRRTWTEMEPVEVMPVPSPVHPDLEER